MIIGIAGGSGSGKTTFAEKVLALANSEHIGILSMDSYYKPIQPKQHFTESGKPNFDHPEAFDWDLLVDHLEQLKRGQSVEAPIYNFNFNKRESGETTLIGPCKVLVLEGIFSLFNEDIRSLLDIKCFLQVDADIRFTRRLHRDIKSRGRSVQSVIDQYYETVRPMYQKFLDPQRQYADFIVGEETDTAAVILSARIKELLSDIPAPLFQSPKIEESFNASLQ